MKLSKKYKAANTMKSFHSSLYMLPRHLVNEFRNNDQSLKKKLILKFI